MSPALRDLAELEPAELESALQASGYERFHARQIYRWIYRRGVTDFEPDDRPVAGAPRPASARSSPSARRASSATRRSSDGTRKFALELADGRRIESVFIPDTPSMTFCISTQVGCAMACGFCLTGKMGLVRNLTAGEIAGQVRVLAAATGLLDHPFNIVLMGMGEPLHNYEQTR